MKDSGDKTTPKGCVKDRKGKKKKISNRTKLERKNERGTGTRGQKNCTVIKNKKGKES